MLEKKRPRVILLEDNDAILQSANAILSQQGWDVTCEQESKKALATLQESKDGPFALFISNFKLPKMEGDDVLKLVKKISPLTQRMLMISSEEPDILINAINKAEINACITAPFKAEDLIDQTRNCFRHFKSEIKRRRLKRVTVHQNKQMFKVAQKLRKKDESAQKKIEDKKQKLFKLNSKIRALESKKELNSDISLSTFIDHKDITPDKDTFKAEFTELSGNIKSVFDAFSSHKKIPVSDLDMGRIFSTSKTSQSSEEESAPEEQVAEERDAKEQAVENRETEEEVTEELPPDEQAADGEKEEETQDSETSLPEDNNRINPDIFDTIVKFALIQSLDKPAADPDLNSAPP